MYRLSLIVVGKLKNRSITALCEDYLKRLQRHARIDCVELRDGDVDSEGRRILEVLEKRPSVYTLALAEEGRLQTSRKFAEVLLAEQGKPMCFIIGGAFGLSSEVKARADGLLSLSSMTLTHEFARLLLMEQLYRAAAINSGSKYHHD
ncbi:MAG: 23S rRNA (pseudouridine(1915)-N(3))-methyltransferase RlmH [Coraliomargarita sp. TMED73]|nr:MAG: 23S rRNA (pseudouridine(1915)-N(3))-methyltransferase RlmH [Coraliomargarita sp. TMED73]|tara:strand:+ start:715 stop:1158 length:444 start_codon:yes stop_codon:yes gene_type:complete